MTLEELTDTEKIALTKTNQFALNLYSELDTCIGGNFSISPWSILSNLVIAYEGAKGNTAKEMKNALYLPEDNAITRSLFAKINNQLKEENKKGELNIANALWIENHSSLSVKNYKNLVEQTYHGKIGFFDTAEKTRSVENINNLVKEQTNNRIEGLIEENDLRPSTKVVLTNASYFKGEWETPFKKKDTIKSNFTTSPFKSVIVPLMGLSGKFDYEESDKVQILKMPYQGRELSMLILLPKKDSPRCLEDYFINTKEFAKLIGGLKEEKVDVRLPKFELKTKYRLMGALDSIGFNHAFSEGADFSGISSGNEGLYLKEMIHQVGIKVDEGKSNLATKDTSSQKYNKSFNAVRPFTFVVQNKEGGILYMGKVTNPLEL